MDRPRRGSATRRLALQNQSDLPLFAQPAPLLVYIEERLEAAATELQAARETLGRPRKARAPTTRNRLEWTASDDKTESKLPEEEYAANFDIINLQMSTTREENDAISDENKTELDEKNKEAAQPVGTYAPVRKRDMLRVKFEKLRLKAPSDTPAIFASKGWEPPPSHETMGSNLSEPLLPEPPRPLGPQEEDPVAKAAPKRTSLAFILGPSSDNHGPSPLISSPEKWDGTSMNEVSQQKLTVSGPISTSSSQQLPQVPYPTQQPSEASETQPTKPDGPNIKPNSVGKVQLTSPEKKPHKSTEKERELFQRLNGPDGIVNPNGPCNYCRNNGIECRVMASEVDIPSPDRHFLRCNNCCRRKAGVEACNISPEEARRKREERAAKSEDAKAKKEAATARREATKADEATEKAEKKLEQEVKGSKKRSSASSSATSEGRQSPTKRRKTKEVTSKVSTNEGQTGETSEEQSRNEEISTEGSKNNHLADGKETGEEEVNDVTAKAKGC